MCAHSLGAGARARLRAAAGPAAGDARHGRSSTGFVRRSRACARESGLEHEATIVGAFPVIAGAPGAGAPGHRSDRARSECEPRRRHACGMLLGAQACSRARSPRSMPISSPSSDHGMNASTFTTRVMASTQADLFAAVTGRLLRADRAAAWRRAGAGAGDAGRDRHARAHQAVGGRGAGARRADDGLRPSRLSRARPARRRAEGRDRARWPPTAPTCRSPARSRPISASALRKKNPERPLETNVEFFTAILLDALEIPRQAFTPIFAVARAAGWTAHALEHQRTGRLIRPSSSYAGAMPKS